MESAVNELADMLHMDPADLRLKNIVREGEIMPQYYNEKLNACALDRCLLRAMDMIGWRDKPLAVDLGDRVRALGCALTMQGSGISNVDIGGIDMRLEEDGFITIGTGATDNGMGVDTILAQIAPRSWAWRARSLLCAVWIPTCRRSTPARTRARVRT